MLKHEASDFFFGHLGLAEQAVHKTVTYYQLVKANMSSTCKQRAAQTVLR